MLLFWFILKYFYRPGEEIVCSHMDDRAFIMYNALEMQYDAD